MLTYSGHLFGKPFSAAAINRWEHNYSSFSEPNQDIGTQFTTDLNLRLGLSRYTSVEAKVSNLFDRDNRRAIGLDVGIPTPDRMVVASIVINLDD